MPGKGLLENTYSGKQNQSFVDLTGGLIMKKRHQETFIRVGLEAFHRLTKYYPLYQSWKDFTLWAACQVANRNIHEQALQGRILSNYPAGTKQLFLAVCNELYNAIVDNPHQNAMLKLMIAMGLDDRDTYADAELSAKNLLLNQIESKYNAGATLESIQRATIDDKDCAINNGSSLIALANIFMALFPRDYQNRVLFVVPEASDRLSHFMAFAQLSIMGFPAYTAPRESIVCDLNGDALFAPKSAVCSPAFFSEYWEEARWESILKVHGI